MRSLVLVCSLVGHAQSARDSCSEVGLTERTDCGFSGVDQAGCESRGCCWGPVQPNPNNLPWCYSSPAPAPSPSPTPSDECGLAISERTDCGFAGVDQGSCEGRGCCWVPVDPNPSNAPWCFNKGSAPTPAPPTPTPSPPSPPPTPTPPPPTPPPPTPPTPPPAPPAPAPSPGPLPDCSVFHANQCQGDAIETDPKFEASRWYTPQKGDPEWQDSFQDYGVLVAHARVVYTDATLTAATVEVVAEHKDPSVTLTYVLGGKQSSSAKVDFDKAQTEPLTIGVRGSDGSKINIDPIDFRWNAPAVTDRPGDYRGGQKGAIVELFGWPHKDVEQECKDLAAMGYMGVKLFPVMEQVMSTQPFNGFMNPWSFMYQPVSYRLQGRMGNRDELRSAIAACRSYGVRVYADAVINHMTGSGNDANPHHRNPDAGCATWGNKTSSLDGGSSPMWTQGFVYTVGAHTGEQPMQEFPAVPYGPLDFHCERSLNSWTDPVALNAGWLVGLTDLNTERENVRERIADYMTDLIGIGFSGFRVDAAKHIHPDDLAAIFAKLKRNLGGALPSDFFTWLEIILGGEADLLMCNSGSGYNFGSYFTGKLAEAGFSAEEINMIKTWNTGYPKEPQKGTDDCDGASEHLKRQVVQNDDHDQQNPGSSSRDMGDTGCVLIKGCEESEHRAFEMKLFTSPNGASDNDNDFPIRNILSSFYWGTGEVQGIPDGLSDCSLCTVDCDTCRGMPYQKAYDPTSTGYDKGDGKYTRTHRDIEIVNAMRSWMGLSSISASVYATSAEMVI